MLHRLQTLRRNDGFNIADHINTYYQGDDYIRQVFENRDLAGYIVQETLSSHLIAGVPEEVEFRETYKLGDYNVTLGVQKLG